MSEKLNLSESFYICLLFYILDIKMQPNFCQPQRGFKHAHPG